MAIRPIVRLGHPALRTPAEPLTPEQLSSQETQQLIDDMLETMTDAEGVGLAAPQVGLGLQLFVYLDVGAEGDREGPEGKVLVNPALDPVSRDLVYDWEGCLSIPDLRGLVPRYSAMQVHALDRHGGKVEFLAEGYEARIIQHEFDHLNGRIFLDRMRDMRSLAYGAEWEEFMTEGDEPSASG